MRYENHICPACAEKFNETDDVVVCPVCGTPQHRRCWTQGGGCVNAALHGEGYVWGEQNGAPAAAKAEDRFCPVCGARNAPNALACGECGNPFVEPAFTDADEAAIPADVVAFFMRGVNEPPDATLDGIPLLDAAMYIRVRARKYIPKFMRAEKTGRVAGWNWGAFLFAPFWFFYRKIYKMGAAFLSLMLILLMLMSLVCAAPRNALRDVLKRNITVSEGMTMTELLKEYAALPAEKAAEVEAASKAYSRVLMLAAAVVFAPNVLAALFADALYRKKIHRAVTVLKLGALNERMFRSLLMRRGGVSYVLPFGACMLVSAMLNLTLYI